MVQEIKDLREALAFEDVLLVPKYSNISSRKNLDVSTMLTRTIKLSIPIVSGDMDTVTESKMAIAMARLGGIGFIHRFMPLEDQANEVLKVKRAEAIIIEKPYTLTPNHTLKDAKKLMEQQNITGIPITDEVGRFVGILTNRDMLFEDNLLKSIEEIMTKKSDAVYGSEGINIEAAKKILKENKIEKLPLLDKNGMLKGLVTSKDLLTKDMYPNASKDKKGRLLAGATIGVKGDYLERVEALLNVGCDVLCIDIAHGHSELVIDTIKALRDKFGDIQIVAGNVATAEGTLDLINAGADGVRTGIGNGRICTTRIVTGSGVPQLTAIIDCAKVAKDFDVPIMADGGTGGITGNIVKSMAAGASNVMLHGTLAGTDESPGVTLIKNGMKYKVYRGSASFGASMARSERFGKEIDEDYNPEGVEALVPYKGNLNDVMKQILSGLRSGMSYCGAWNIKELHEKAEFIRITNAGWKESLPHNVDVVK